MNDICNVSHLCTILYADDTSVAVIDQHLDNCQLTGTECCKYLGVILDSKIAWVQHITYVKSKVFKGIGIMYQARKYLDRFIHI